jgi:hypothetical protein
VPTLRLKPEPKEVEREPPPPEAAARVADPAAEIRPSEKRPVEARPVEARAPEGADAPPVAVRSTERAEARLANVPGVKPAVVPQVDARQRTTIPPKPPTPSPAEEAAEAVKEAQAKAAREAAATAAAQPPKPPTPQAAASTPATPPSAATQSSGTPTPPAETVARVEDEKTMAPPVPRQRPAEPTAQPPAQQQPAQQAPAQQQATAGAGSGRPAGGAGAPGTGTGAGQQRAGDPLQRALADLKGKIGGTGAGRDGVPSGTAAAGSQLSEMQIEGSRLAQACLEERKVFKLGDDISATFQMRVERGARQLHMLPEHQVHRGNRLTGPRIAEIDTALNGCEPFKKFVLAQAGVTTFSFTFESGRR